MDECTSIIMNSFHPLQRTLFNKEFVVKVWGGGVLKERMKTNKGGGSSLYVKAHFVKKIA